MQLVAFVMGACVVCLTACGRTEVSTDSAVATNDPAQALGGSEAIQGSAPGPTVTPVPNNSGSSIPVAPSVSSSSGGSMGTKPTPSATGQPSDCTACSAANCGPQIHACKIAPGCEEGFRCLADTCKNSDSTGCALTCFSANQANLIAALEIFACAAAKCPAGCSGL